MDVLHTFSRPADARHFKNLVVHRYDKTVFMMTKKKDFIRIRVEQPRKTPIDCMLYQIEPDVFWTRSLYEEDHPQQFYNPDDALGMLETYVHTWMGKNSKKQQQQDIPQISEEDFFGLSPRDALLLRIK